MIIGFQVSVENVGDVFLGHIVVAVTQFWADGCTILAIFRQLNTGESLKIFWLPLKTTLSILHSHYGCSLCMALSCWTPVPEAC